MIRSLRTGVTGLRGNQLRLDAIGNNIANVNTTGFKRSRVLFQETLAQRIATGGRLVGSTSPGVSNSWTECHHVGGRTRQTVPSWIRSGARAR